MRSLTLKVRSARTSADEAYDRIRDFERYPDLVDEVQSVAVRPNVCGAMASDWQVYFRNGPLRWSEVDHFHTDHRTITFEQTTGDFEVLHGSWTVERLGAGCEVVFDATFDFGIPSLAGVLEPIAVKVLKEGITLILYRLLDDAMLVDDAPLHAAVTARLGDSQRFRARRGDTAD